MKITLKNALFLLSLVLMPSLYAQTPASSPQTAEDERILAILGNASEHMAPQVMAVLNAQQKKMDPACPTLSSVKSSHLSLFASPMLDLNGLPKGGAWQVRYHVKACKESFTRTVMFSGKVKEAKKKPDEEVGTIALYAAMPGQTLADPTLGEDVWKSLQGVALRAQPECKMPPVLKDAQILDTPKNPTSKWRELWQVRVCNATLVQVVTFYPTPDGTMFRMTMPKGPQTPTQLHIRKEK